MPTDGGRRTSAVLAIALLGVLGVLAYYLVPGWMSTWRADPIAVEHGRAPSPSVPHYVPPTDLPTSEPGSSDPSGVQEMLVERDLRRAYAAASAAPASGEPYFTDPRQAPYLPSVLVLPARTEPYGLESAELARLGAVTRRADGAAELHVPVLVAPGATLRIDSRRTPSVVLDSEAAGYASIIAVDADVQLVGTRVHPLEVTAASVGDGTPDQDTTDGRAYLLAIGSALRITHAALTHLGFSSGVASGVAWAGSDAQPSRGEAVDSTFSGNVVGAYVEESSAVRIERSGFVGNVVDGLHAHAAPRVVVADSVAIHNGRHGILLSKGTSDSTVTNVEVSGNGGSGLVVDDGDTSHGEVPTPSNSNLLADVIAQDNAVAGITIEGGLRNAVEHATVKNNRIGIWVRAGASGTSVAGSTVTATEGSAVLLSSGAAGTVVADSVLTGQRDGVEANGVDSAELRDVRITASSDTAIDLDGARSDLDLDNVTVEGDGRRLAATANGAELIGGPGELNTAGWRGPPREPDAPMSMVPFVKAIPWLLILTPILVMGLLTQLRVGRTRNAAATDRGTR